MRDRSWRGAAAKSNGRFAERNALDLLDETNRVAAGVTSETDPPPRARIGGQVGASMVTVERTSTRERAAGTAKLDSALSNDVDDRMLLAQQVGVDAP